MQKKGLRLGKGVVIVDSFFFDPAHCYLISIGDNSTICPNVKLIAHDASMKRALGFTKIGRITIGKNCFIGDSAIVLPNVTIGDNSIIGAGSVVNRSIPPNTVAAGNPAKKISSTDVYIEKTSTMKNGNRLFGRKYLISNLSDVTRKELLTEVENKNIAFIK